MPNLKELWRAWDQNPVSVSNRRFLYYTITPLSLIGLVWTVAAELWVGAGFMIVFLGIALESGARTPGTRVSAFVRRARRSRS